MAAFLKELPLVEIGLLILMFTILARVGYELMYYMYSQEVKTQKYKQVTKKVASGEDLTDEDQLYLNFTKDREYKLKTLDGYTVKMTFFSFVVVALLFVIN